MTHEVIPAQAVEAAHRAWREQAKLDGSIFEYNLRAAIEAAVVHVQRPTVTEWGAGFPTHPYPYNYHQSRDEAQKYVDGMKEVGVNMAVMTREVIPAEATAWKPADSHTSIGASQ
jgi:hypothetical protein